MSDFPQDIICPFCNKYSSNQSESDEVEHYFHYLGPPGEHAFFFKFYNDGSKHDFSIVFPMTSFQIENDYKKDVCKETGFSILGQEIYWEYEAAITAQQIVNQAVKKYNELYPPLEEKCKKLKHFL